MVELKWYVLILVIFPLGWSSAFFGATPAEEIASTVIFCHDALGRVSTRTHLPMPSTGPFENINANRLPSLSWEQAKRAVLAAYASAVGIEFVEHPKILGAGSYGIVYEFLDQAGAWAIKIPGVRYFQFHSEYQEGLRLKKEADIYNTVKNSGHEGAQYLLPAVYKSTPKGPTLRYPEMATNLKDQQGKLEPSEVLEIGIQLAAAVEAMQGAGWVHQDLKPGNTFRAPDGSVKVGDYGAAARLGSAYETQEGTPEFVPYEYLAEVGQPIGEDRDVFAVLKTMDKLLPEPLPLVDGLNAHTVLVWKAPVLLPKYSRYTHYSQLEKQNMAPKLNLSETRQFRMISSLHQARATFKSSLVLGKFLRGAMAVESHEQLQNWYKDYFNHLNHSLGRKSTMVRPGKPGLIDETELANIIFSDVSNVEYYMNHQSAFSPEVNARILKSLRDGQSTDYHQVKRDSLRTAAFRIPELVKKALSEIK